MNENKTVAELLKELNEKHREIKQDILDLSEKASTPNYSKERIKDELFKIFLKIK